MPDSPSTSAPIIFEVFPWNENFSVGIPIVDAQHQNLVCQINQIAYYLAHPTEQVDIDQLFNSLRAYADFHFKTEEEIWARQLRNHPWIIAHERCHDDFLPAISRIENSRERLTTSEIQLETLQFLVKWLVQHILDRDRRMAKLLVAIESGLSSEEAISRVELEMSGLMRLLADTLLSMYEAVTVRSIALIRDKHELLRIQEHALRLEAQQNLLEKTARCMRQTVQAMATTIEMRSPYTSGHQYRVALLAKSIAQEMGLSEDEVDGIYLAAMVHDMGEVLIPAEIMVKPSILSVLEFELVKTHPRAGYEILKDIDFPWPLAMIVLQHHERLNGSGYPSGLHGDQIEFGAKILAVADVVEAMSSHRTYRPALGIDRALHEIDLWSGIHFDDRVVRACLGLFRQQKFRF